MAESVTEITDQRGKDGSGDSDEGEAQPDRRWLQFADAELRLWQYKEKEATGRLERGPGE